MKIGVVLPTIEARRTVFEQTLAAYEATESEHDVEVAIVEDVHPLGRAWNQGAEDLSDCDYLHFAVDDASPDPGWVEGALEVAHDARSIACPRLSDPTGALQMCGSMGFGQVLADCPTGTECRSSPLPFMSMQIWSEVGEFMLTHFFIDDDWCFRANKLGYRVRVARDYHLTHLHLKDARAIQSYEMEKLVFLRRCMGESLVEVPA